MPSNELGPYTPGGIVPSRIYGLGRSVARLYEQRRRNSGPQYAQSSLQRKLGSGFKPAAARRLSFGPAMPINAGATNVIQRAVIKQRSGKRVKRKSVNYLYRLQKAITSTCVLRWNAMSEYDTNGFLKIGYNRTTPATGPGDYQYPVYIFDLTSCRMNVLGSALTANPMYRLTSDTVGNGNFTWTVVSGQPPAGGGSAAGWQMEQGRGSDVVANTPTFGLNSMLAWSDIRLAMYGATNQTTRFTVSFIQFVDETYHPNADKKDPAVPAALDSTVNDQQGRFNAAMVEFVKPLVYHPLHTAGNAKNVFRVLESRTFSVQPDTQTNEAKASPNVCYKLFKRMNRICKWQWQTSDKKATTTSTEHKIVPDAAGGLDTSPDYNQFFGGTKKPFVHPNARVYMMITAQAYTRTGIGPDGSTVEATAANQPSIDVQVRNKWLYDAN